MRGQGVSKGLCCAKVLILEEKPIIFPTETESPEIEQKKFLDAQTAILKETEQLRDRAYKTVGEEAAEILDAHCSMLQDEGVLDPVKESIQSGKNAACAVDEVMNLLIEQFEQMENEYFAQRASDLKDIRERLLRKLLHIEKEDLSFLADQTIIAGRDIAPSTTAGMDVQHLAGMLMEFGGTTSHTAILARTLDVPAVVGVTDLTKKIKTGDLIAFDGTTGEVFMNLSAEQIKQFRDKMKQEKEYKETLHRLAGKPAVTKDQKRLEVCGNIGTPKDLIKVTEYGADGVGLFRSEFLYLSSQTLPTEEQQFQAYKKVLQGMEGKPVIVRTLDIGGDKEVKALGLQKEENPFLGLRAIRLCRNKPDVFETQLRALLRASVYGSLKIMFPMVSSMQELSFAKEELRKCKDELAQNDIPYAKDIPVGIMVEIPSTAVMAKRFAAECDFFSIGTNDLTQYTLAVDRGNDSVSNLYSYFHPAVLQLIKSAIDGAHANHIPCGMCGEAAGNIYMLPLLIGLGLDEYSMTASSILELKKTAGSMEVSECQELAEHVMQLDTAEEIQTALKEYVDHAKKHNQ